MFQNPDALIQLLTTLKSEQEQNALLRAQREANAKSYRSDAAKSGVFRYCVIFVVSDYYQHDSRKVGNKCPKVK